MEALACGLRDTYVFLPAAQEDVRLVNFANATGPGSQYEGRVEVYHEGEWGTICDNDWTFQDAIVACRMAGFSTAVRPVTSGYYGRGTGRIWLDHVRCTGTESTLDSCFHSDWGTVDPSCNQHEKDAGVVCSDGELN